MVSSQHCPPDHQLKVIGCVQVSIVAFNIIYHEEMVTVYDEMKSYTNLVSTGFLFISLILLGCFINLIC